MFTWMEVIRSSRDLLPKRVFVQLYEGAPAPDIILDGICRARGTLTQCCIAVTIVMAVRKHHLAKACIGGSSKIKQGLITKAGFGLIV